MEKAAPPTKQFKVYTQQWIVLISFCTLIWCLARIWITWNPIAKLMANLWKVPLSHIDALSGVYLCIYVLFAMASLWFVNRYSLCLGLCLAAVFNAGGAFLCYVGQDIYLQVYIGMMLCAVAQTFTLAAPPLVSTKLFAAHKWATAAAVGGLCNIMSTALGLGAIMVVNFEQPASPKMNTKTATAVARSTG